MRPKIASKLSWGDPSAEHEGGPADGEALAAARVQPALVSMAPTFAAAS
jgi:hypothetical protein